MAAFKQIVKRVALILIAAYRCSLASVLGGQCRFTPTCSKYAQDALEQYPIGRALAKIANRLLRCHPFAQGGWDPA